MGNLYVGNTNSIAREANKIYVGDSNGIAREVQNIYVGDSNGIARELYSAYIPPIKIASNVGSGSIDISAYPQKNVNNFIVDAIPSVANTNTELRGARIYFAKSISGNTLTIQAYIQAYLFGTVYASASLTFDVWCVSDPSNRLLGVSPVNIAGKSTDITKYACEPRNGEGVSDYAVSGAVKGTSYKGISGNNLTAYVTAYTNDRTLVTTASNVYYLGDL